MFFFTTGIGSSPDQDAVSAYRPIAARMLKKGLNDLGAFQYLKSLTALGPRLTGSPQAAAAVEFIYQKMKDLDLDNVHLEPTTVGHWVRGKKENGRIISSSYGSFPLHITAIGGSIATPPLGITGPVIEVRSFAELKKLGTNAEGAIIFFNRPMNPGILNTFQAYGMAVNQRIMGASQAAKFGAAAVLVRSLTTRLDNNPHTGMMSYIPGIQKIPAACISTKDAELLSALLRKDDSLQINFTQNCKNLTPVISHNVVGEITGSEQSHEIILVGGHLDSWDLGTGAHDDGAGCMHALEALRLIKTLGLKPKRTIRAVMFMDEEFGGTGGRDYPRSELRKNEIHLAAIESDSGGFLPLGFNVGRKNMYKKFKKWESLFRRIGLYSIGPNGGGADIGPLSAGGTLLINLIPNSQRYFDVHHSALDVLDAVNPRELELGAVAVGLFAYVLAQDYPGSPSR